MSLLFLAPYSRGWNRPIQRIYYGASRVETNRGGNSVASNAEASFWSVKSERITARGWDPFFFSPWGLFPYFIAILGEKRRIRSDGRTRRSDAAYLSAVRKASLHPAYVNYVNCARGGVLKDRPIALVRPFGAGPSPIVEPCNSNTRYVRSTNITFASTITVDVCIVYLHNVYSTYVFLSCDRRVVRLAGLSYLATILSMLHNFVPWNCLENKLALQI